MKIIMTGNLWPRDKFDYFNKNRDQYDLLREGEIIDVPKELFEQMRGVSEVTEDSTKRNYKTKKEKIVNLNETLSLNDNDDCGCNR